MITNVAAALKTVIAISFVDSGASLQCDGSGMDESTPFSIFETQFKDAFVPNDFFGQVRARISAFKMTSTVAQYVAE
ncbi:hypothetical protein BGZ99_002066, partial [Dissophora globulifera]